MHGLVGVNLSRLQENGREVRLVDRIREVLGLEANPMVLLVFLAALTDVGAVEIVPGVELDTRLRGQDLEQTTGARVIERRGQRQGVVLRVEACLLYTSPSPRDS